MAEDAANRVLRTTVELDDGESREVEVEVPDDYLTPDEIRESYVPKASHNAAMAKLRKERTTVDEILENDDMLARIAGKRADFFRDQLQIDGGKPDIDKYQEAWRQQELTPLREELEQERERGKSLLSSLRDKAVSEAAVDADVKKSLRDLVQSYYAPRIAWSEEHGDWFLVDESGEFLVSGVRDSPYRTIAEDLEMKARSGDFEDWFDGKGRTGPDYQGGGGDRRPGQMELDEFQKLPAREQTKFAQDHPDRYQKLMDELTDQNMKKLAGG